MTETTYPAWQENIRKAQIAQQILDEVAADKEREEQAKVGAEHGRNLARVLEVAFGIKVEPPLKNELILDGFIFVLKTEYSAYDNEPLFCEEVVKVKNGGDWTRFSFTLYVNAVRPDYMHYDEWDSWPRSEVFASSNGNIAQDWTYIRAKMAKALDSQKLWANNEVKAYEAHKEKLANGLIPPPQMARISIEDLFREIAKEAAREIVEGINDAVDY